MQWQVGGKLWATIVKLAFYDRKIDQLKDGFVDRCPNIFLGIIIK